MATATQGKSSGSSVALMILVLIFAAALALSGGHFKIGGGPVGGSGTVATSTGDPCQNQPPNTVVQTFQRANGKKMFLDCAALDQTRRYTVSKTRNRLNQMVACMTRVLTLGTASSQGTATVYTWTQSTGITSAVVTDSSGRIISAWSQGWRACTHG